MILLVAHYLALSCHQPEPSWITAGRSHGPAFLVCVCYEGSLSAEIKEGKTEGGSYRIAHILYV